MSDTDNTQDTNVTTEQLYSTVRDLLSNLQGYADAMKSEATFIFDSVASTDFNPTTVDDVAAQIETHLPAIEMLKSAFLADMTAYNASSEAFSVMPDKDSFETEDVKAERESMAIQIEIEFNNSVSLIESSLSNLAERKVPEDMKEQFNAAMIGIIQIGNPLAEMYMGTIFVIQSLTSVYNTCYRTPIDESLAIEGQAKPLTRDQLVLLVDGVNNFLSNVFAALMEKDEIYANCVDYINNLPEVVKNHYYIRAILGQLDMILNMTNSNEETIKIFSTAINEGIPTPGPKGDTGAKGDKGNKGDKGDAGPSGTLTLDYLKAGITFGGGVILGAVIAALMFIFI